MVREQVSGKTRMCLRAASDTRYVTWLYLILYFASLLGGFSSTSHVVVVQQGETDERGSTVALERKRKKGYPGNIDASSLMCIILRQFGQVVWTGTPSQVLSH